MISLKLKTLAAFATMLCATLALAGCGGGGGGSGTASVGSGSVTTLISANSNAAGALTAGVLVPEDLTRMHSRSPVDVADIDSLFVTVTRITLDRVGNPNPGGKSDSGDDSDVLVEVSNAGFAPADVAVEVGDSVTWVWVEDGLHTVTSGNAGDPDAGDLFDASGELVDDFFTTTFQLTGTYPYHSSEPDDVTAGMAGTVTVNPDSSGAPPKIVIFEGALRVNLLDLTPVSDVLSTATVPAGRYNGVRLNIESPELFLAAAPTVPITDIGLTANGRLFIKEKFEIVDGENVLLILDFGSIHIVDNGGGSYTLTPQLRALLDIVAAEVEIAGIIVGVDDVEQTVLVALSEGGEVLVKTDSATTYAFSDTSAASFGSLELDQQVRIEGTLNVDETVDATHIEIQVEEEPVT